VKPRALVEQVSASISVPEKEKRNPSKAIIMAPKLIPRADVRMRSGSHRIAHGGET